MACKTEKNFHVFYVLPKSSRLRIIKKKGFPQNASEKRKREEGKAEKKLRKLKLSFIDAKKADTKSHASFNADRHKYHTIYL